MKRFKAYFLSSADQILHGISVVNESSKEEVFFSSDSINDWIQIGFMKNFSDLEGLKECMVQNGYMKDEDELL